MFYCAIFSANTGNNAVQTPLEIATSKETETIAEYLDKMCEDGDSIANTKDKAGPSQSSQLSPISELPEDDDSILTEVLNSDLDVPPATEAAEHLFPSEIR